MIYCTVGVSTRLETDTGWMRCYNSRGAERWSEATVYSLYKDSDTINKHLPALVHLENKTLCALCASPAGIREEAFQEAEASDKAEEEEASDRGGRGGRRSHH